MRIIWINLITKKYNFLSRISPLTSTPPSRRSNRRRTSTQRTTCPHQLVRPINRPSPSLCPLRPLMVTYRRLRCPRCLIRRTMATLTEFRPYLKTSRCFSRTLIIFIFTPNKTTSHRILLFLLTLRPYLPIDWSLIFHPCPRLHLFRHSCYWISILLLTQQNIMRINISEQ